MCDIDGAHDVANNCKSCVRGYGDSCQLLNTTSMEGEHNDHIVWAVGSTFSTVFICGSVLAGLVLSILIKYAQEIDIPGPGDTSSGSSNNRWFGTGLLAMSLLQRHDNGKFLLAKEEKRVTNDKEDITDAGQNQNKSQDELEVIESENQERICSEDRIERCKADEALSTIEARDDQCEAIDPNRNECRADTAQSINEINGAAIVTPDKSSRPQTIDTICFRTVKRESRKESEDKAWRTCSADPFETPKPARKKGSKRKEIKSNKKKKQMTPEEKMVRIFVLAIAIVVFSSFRALIIFLAPYPSCQRNLSLEFLSLYQKMKRVPKYSPEWTLIKVEIRFIVEELEYLYVTCTTLFHVHR